MASTEKSIDQLPTITSIESGNFVIVQTENATNKLDFKDFVIGLENTTFASVLSGLSTNDAAVAANTTRSTANASSITTSNSNIAAVTTKVDALESSVGNLNIDSNGAAVFTTLSAGSLSANGNEFKGYPAISQVIYKPVTRRSGNGATDVGLDLVTNVNLKSSNSKLKVSFSVPGTAIDNHSVALVVQESPNNSNYIDVVDFLGETNGSAVVGTSILGTDTNHEGATSAFSGIFTPASLGTGNNIFIRVVIRFESGNDFYQNSGGGATATGTNDATGISNLLIEEIFV